MQSVLSALKNLALNFSQLGVVGDNPEMVGQAVRHFEQLDKDMNSLEFDQDNDSLEKIAIITEMVKQTRNLAAVSKTALEPLFVSYAESVSRIVEFVGNAPAEDNFDDLLWRRGRAHGGASLLR